MFETCMQATLSNAETIALYNSTIVNDQVDHFLAESAWL